MSPKEWPHSPPRVAEIETRIGRHLADMPPHQPPQIGRDRPKLAETAPPKGVAKIAPNSPSSAAECRSRTPPLRRRSGAAGALPEGRWGGCRGNAGAARKAPRPLRAGDAEAEDPGARRSGRSATQERRARRAATCAGGSWRTGA